MYRVGKYKEVCKREGSLITNTGQAGNNTSISTALLEKVDNSC